MQDALHRPKEHCLSVRVYWSSSENDNNNAWAQNFSDGNQNNNNKNNTNGVRCARDFSQKEINSVSVRRCSASHDHLVEFFMQQLSFNFYLDKITLPDLLEAYFDCRQAKRNTINAIHFEANYEEKLVVLCDEINNGIYQPGRSIAFIVKKPVWREIFAADFRDRVVHHWLINKLNPLFEKAFINDAYACRVDKGTHFGIKRMDRFIRQCSQNYTQDCYILKCDIQSFFMTIDKTILWSRLQAFIEKQYHDSDKTLVLEITKKIIDLDPTYRCHLKSPRTDWEVLPKSKSLFHTKPQCGLPIGNLTSQIFANFYMNVFDHFCKNELKLRYYGRYVDDFFIAHKDEAYLKSLIPLFNRFLKRQLGLTLHPKKIQLQYYKNGVQFLGVVIKPNRLYIANRTKANLYDAILSHNKVAIDHKPSKEEKLSFLSSMNSYFGIMKHYDANRLKWSLLKKNLSPLWVGRINRRKSRHAIYMLLV